VRRAYLEWIDGTQRDMSAIATLMLDTTTEKSADELVDGFAGHMRRSRSFRAPRRAARAYDKLSDVDDQFTAWDYTELVTRVLVRGELGSDSDVEALMRTVGIPGTEPIAERVRVLKAVHASIKLSSLREVALSAPVGEIAAACDEVVVLFLGFVALTDAWQLLGDFARDQVPAALCEIFRDDPRELAVLALILTAVKHNPELSPFGAWLVDMEGDPAPGAVYVSLSHFAGALPQIEMLTGRYLANWPRRDSLLASLASTA
jgi:hypothetical protein